MYDCTVPMLKRITETLNIVIIIEYWGIYMIFSSYIVMVYPNIFKIVINSIYYTFIIGGVVMNLGISDEVKKEARRLLDDTTYLSDAKEKFGQGNEHLMYANLIVDAMAVRDVVRSLVDNDGPHWDLMYSYMEKGVLSNSLGDIGLAERTIINGLRDVYQEGIAREVVGGLLQDIETGFMLFDAISHTEGDMYLHDPKEPQKSA